MLVISATAIHQLKGPLKMVQQAKLPLVGATKRSYGFQVYTWGTNFNRAGAVYAVLKQTSPGRYQVIYIGQTGDLSQRFNDHHKQGCFDRNGKTHIGVYPEPTESKRFDVETDLVRNYNPTCND